MMSSLRFKVALVFERKIGKMTFKNRFLSRKFTTVYTTKLGTFETVRLDGKIVPNEIPNLVMLKLTDFS